MAIYKVKPLYDQTIWADNRLSTMRNVEGDGWGTSWEISFHKYGSNQVNDTSETLLELLDKDSSRLIGDIDKERVLRLAYLDAKADLSIQLHPTNDYAAEHGVDYGKYEAWYIIDAKEGSTLVAGSKTTDVEKFKAAIKSNQLEDLLVYHTVKPGDFIYLPAGCVHALGGGILAIEVSTNSNTTYRVYDYGRTDKEGNTRELHLDKVFDNLDLTMLPKLGHVPDVSGTETVEHVFLETDHFSWISVDIFGDYEIINNTEALYVTVLDEDITVTDSVTEIKAAQYDHIFVGADTKDLKFSGRGRILIGRSVGIHE